MHLFPDPWRREQSYRNGSHERRVGAADNHIQRHDCRRGQWANGRYQDHHGDARYDPGAETIVQQSTTGQGKIVLDDGAGSATALNGNGGIIQLTAGMGGIAALSASNNAAEIATSGIQVTFDTSGPIGTSSNRIQFANNSNAVQQLVMIGMTNEPSGVYLDGLGSINLSSILGSPGAPIDVTARTNLVVFFNTIVGSGSKTPSTLSLGADLTPAGVGDDGVGTLTIDAGATVYGAQMTLRGADVNIAPTATVGDRGNVPVAMLTGALTPYALAFDRSGNLFAANEVGNTVSEYAPGSTSPIAILTGVTRPFGLAFDKLGNLFVANSLTNTVSEFAPGATTPSSTLGGLNDPTFLAFDSKGNLFVANAGGGSVSEFSPGATNPSATISALNNVYALAIDPSDNVYVGDIQGGTILKFNSANVAIKTILSGCKTPTQ